MVAELDYMMRVEVDERSVKFRAALRAGLKDFDSVVAS